MPDAPQHCLCGRRLAAARFAHEGEELAARDRQGDALDGVHASFRLPGEAPDESAADRVADDQALNLEQRFVAVDAHGAATARTSLRWQAAAWPSPIAFSSGRIVGQGSKARSQRGWKGQPRSSRSRRGGAPGMEAAAPLPPGSRGGAKGSLVYGKTRGWDGA